MRIAKLMVATLALACGNAWAQDEEESPHAFSVTATATTDYVFRGVSQTQEDPAFQASFDYEHASGFYAGIWGSSVDFTPEDTAPEDEDDADVEIDFIVGYAHEFNDDFSADVQFVRYYYPDTADGVDYDYNELIAALSYRWATFSIGYSNDAFASDETGIYYNLGGSWDLPAELVLSAGVGYYDLDDVLGDSYLDYNLGISRSWSNVEVSLVYYDTNNDGEELFGGIADDRIVATISLTIP